MYLEPSSIRPVRASQTPPSVILFIGIAREASQEQKSPQTATSAAFGAQTLKTAVPSPAEWEPIYS